MNKGKYAMQKSDVTHDATSIQQDIRGCTTVQVKTQPSNDDPLLNDIPVILFHIDTLKHETMTRIWIDQHSIRCQLPHHHHHHHHHQLHHVVSASNI